MIISPALVRPEDILAEGEDFINLQGVTGRKGSVAAFFKNIEALENPEIPAEQKSEVLSVMRELAPILIALGFDKHVTFKNALVQQLLIEAKESSPS